MSNRVLMRLLVVLTVACLAGICAARTWTDRQGRKVEADFLSFQDGKVRVKRESDGRVFEVPLDKLSDADQVFVKSQPTGDGESGGATSAPRPRPGTVIENSIGMKLAFIPAGEFLMGSPESEEGRVVGDELQHRVRITKPFYMGIHEVTHEQYNRIMSPEIKSSRRPTNSRNILAQISPNAPISSQFQQAAQEVMERIIRGDIPPSGDRPSPAKDAGDVPKHSVSWTEAVAFCKKLSELEKCTYRLPTEAEWEYACRAGTTTTWYSGDDEGALKEHGWFTANSGGKMHPVGQKSPNAWGLYDMHGNVWEWCQDWWGDYAAAPATDPRGPDRGSFRVFRGGSWIDSAGNCRAACRIRLEPSGRIYDLGFRLARAVSFASPAR